MVEYLWNLHDKLTLVFHGHILQLLQGPNERERGSNVTCNQTALELGSSDGLDAFLPIFCIKLENKIKVSLKSVTLGWPILQKL